MTELPPPLRSSPTFPCVPNATSYRIAIVYQCFYRVLLLIIQGVRACPVAAARPRHQYIILLPWNTNSWKLVYTLLAGEETAEKLGVGRVAVDLSATKHGLVAQITMVPELWTARPDIAVVLQPVVDGYVFSIEVAPALGGRGRGVR